jgi:hypothetical protein
MKITDKDYISLVHKELGFHVIQPCLVPFIVGLALRGIYSPAEMAARVWGEEGWAYQVAKGPVG